ncbi:unnamed protein product [Boreogadus saida]
MRRTPPGEGTYLGGMRWTPQSSPEDGLGGVFPRPCPSSLPQPPPAPTGTPRGSDRGHPEAPTGTPRGSNRDTQRPQPGHPEAPTRDTLRPQPGTPRGSNPGHPEAPTGTPRGSNRDTQRLQPGHPALGDNRGCNEPYSSNHFTEGAQSIRRRRHKLNQNGEDTEATKTEQSIKHSSADTDRHSVCGGRRRRNLPEHILSLSRRAVLSYSQFKATRLKTRPHLKSTYYYTAFPVLAEYTPAISIHNSFLEADFWVQSDAQC